MRASGALAGFRQRSRGLRALNSFMACQVRKLAGDGAVRGRVRAIREESRHFSATVARTECLNVP